MLQYIIALALSQAPQQAQLKDIAASAAIPVSFDKLAPYAKTLKLKMGEDAWKYSIRELHELFNRRPVPIQLYIDPVRGSNNGVDWA